MPRQHIPRRLQPVKSHLPFVHAVGMAIVAILYQEWFDFFLKVYGHVGLSRSRPDRSHRTGDPSHRTGAKNAPWV